MTGSLRRSGRATSWSTPTSRWPPAAWRRRCGTPNPKGHICTNEGIGEQLALRDLREELPRFFSEIDEAANAVRRAHPKGQ